MRIKRYPFLRLWEGPAPVRLLGLLLAMAAVAATAVVGAPVAHAEVYVPVSGAGSTWSQNALDQWIRNVNQYGMKVNYAGTGSSDGRNQFRNQTVDFAVSEIPYGLRDGGVLDDPPTRGYAYMPIVAGGTAFMYNLKIGNQRVTNLRLSGAVLAKIFTGNIKVWNDPAIRADNPGLALPARRIVPVVRSDGSGTTAQLTTWLSKRYASVWNAYCRKAGRSTPCGVTSFYPVVSGSGFVAQSGSLGVSGYVSQRQSEGAITYVEYSYALNTGFPVAKMLNSKGYYVEPTAQSVAVGLLGAQIDKRPGRTYLTQVLDNVYDSQDARAYPLSSYSYMIVPTKVEGPFNLKKGKTLGAFAYYFLCEGQQQAPKLGYSPLPINLVQAGLEQIRKIPGVVAQSIDVTKCHNPTFSANGTNTLAKNAPYPPACDKRGGPTQCVIGTAGNKTPTKVTARGGQSSGTAGSASPGAAGGAGPSATAGGPAASAGPPVVDPDTGQVLGAAGSGLDVAAVPVSTAVAGGSGLDVTLATLAALLLIGITVGPPLIWRLLGRGKP
jgi:phosphate ABC transporter phosphate-binding protein